MGGGIFPFRSGGLLPPDYRFLTVSRTLAERYPIFQGPLIHGVTSPNQAPHKRYLEHWQNSYRVLLSRGFNPRRQFALFRAGSRFTILHIWRPVYRLERPGVKWPGGYRDRGGLGPPPLFTCSSHEKYKIHNTSTFVPYISIPIYTPAPLNAFQKFQKNFDTTAQPCYLCQQ